MDVNVSITNASPHEIYDLALLFAKDLVKVPLKEPPQETPSVQKTSDAKPPEEPAKKATTKSTRKTVDEWDKEPLTDEELAVIDPCTTNLEALEKYRLAFPDSKRSRQKIQMTWVSRRKAEYKTKGAKDKLVKVRERLQKEAEETGVIPLPPASNDKSFPPEELQLIAAQHGVHDAWEMYRLKYPKSERTKTDVINCWTAMKRGDITVPS